MLAANYSAAASCPALVSTGAGPKELYVKLSTFGYSLLAFVTTLGLLVSLVSNMVIIYLFTNDLLYCTQWPSVIYCCLTQSTWILEHELVCQSFGFITVSTALASILTVLVMSIERAVVIAYSIHAKKRYTIRSAWLIIVLIWIVSLLACLPPLLGKFNRYTLDPSKTSCTLDYLSKQANYKLYILVLYVVFWIAPTVIITISYAVIIVTFKNSSLTLNQIAGRTAHGLPELSSTPPPPTPPTLPPTTSALSTQLTRARSATSGSCKRWLPLGQGSLRRHGDPNRRAPEVAAAPATATTSGHSGPLAKRASLCEVESPEERCQRLYISNSVDLVYKPPPGLLLATLGPSRLRERPLDELRRHQFAGGFCGLAVGGAPSMLQSLRCELTSRQGGSRGSFYRAQAASGPANADQPGLALVQVQQRPDYATNLHLSRTAMQFRLAKMSLYLILLWLVSWTPIASLAMINSIRMCHRASATAVFMASTMTKLGPAFDVFIYGISHPKIKTKFIQIIKWLLPPYWTVTRDMAGSTNQTPGAAHHHRSAASCPK